MSAASPLMRYVGTRSFIFNKLIPMRPLADPSRPPAISACVLSCAPVPLLIKPLKNAVNSPDNKPNPLATRHLDASDQAEGCLRAIGLSKYYGRRQVVKDASLQVNSGEVVGLLGPNGAGKTTSFYMIVGIVPADAGRIEIDGQPITTLPIHQRSRKIGRASCRERVEIAMREVS